MNNPPDVEFGTADESSDHSVSRRDVLRHGAAAVVGSATFLGGAMAHFAGVNTMRDIPEFVRLIESGRFDAKSLVGQTFPLEKAREALQTAADRTAISAVVSFG